MHMYRTKKYIHHGRLMAYLEQFKYCSDDDVVLEIGIGVGVFKDIVSKVAEYYSADVNPDLNPDYIVDISRQNGFFHSTQESAARANKAKAFEAPTEAAV